MFKYPFRQQKFTFFRVSSGLVFCSLLCLITFVAAQHFFAPFGLEQEEFELFMMIGGLLILIMMLFTWISINPRTIADDFNHKAQYEDVLYHMLEKISMSDGPDEFKVTLLEDYLKYLRNKYQHDPTEHLRHLPLTETHTLLKVCTELIKTEKGRLAERLAEGISGSMIQSSGFDIERLENFAQVLAERLQETFTNASIRTQPESTSTRSPQMTGMSMEA